MKERTRVFRFMLIGTLNALITALMIWITMDILALNYLLSNILAYCVAQTNNFIWSKYWIFCSDAVCDETGATASNNKSSTYRQVLLFSFAFSLAYLGQFFFLILLVEWIHLNEYLAQFLGLFVYGAINFIMNRHVTFR